LLRHRPVSFVRRIAWDASGGPE